MSPFATWTDLLDTIKDTIDGEVSDCQEALFFDKSTGRVFRLNLNNLVLIDRVSPESPSDTDEVYFANDEITKTMPNSVPNGSFVWILE